MSVAFCAWMTSGPLCAALSVSSALLLGLTPAPGTIRMNPVLSPDNSLKGPECTPLVLCCYLGL